MAFHEHLRRAWAGSQSMLCVGLDPDPARFPQAVHGSVFDFCAAIVDATADVVCAFKPQIAYFAAEGAEAELERLCTHIRDRHPQALLVLDAKRGDIGSTAQQYAREAFDRYGAHVVTVNPYLGTDSVEPFLQHPGGGVFVLCRTSNKGSGDFQSLTVAGPAGGEPLYEHIARRVAGEWNAIGDCGLVVGATYPDELRRVRAIVGDLPLLVPGVGAQGGDVEATVKAGADSTGFGMVINSSRAVLYASAGDDFAAAARAEAVATRDAINAHAPR
ncbi:MAG: orotidine-5'-phosphate decarboxylase [Actinomycetota bacterium]|nr:orotidine-5'-phosphate decarboxylase [Actinomycetota bacterium]